MSRGRKPGRHNCGEYGRLTINEIAGKTGLTPTGVANRIARGVTGPDLLRPAQSRTSEFRTVEYRGENIRTLGHMTIAVAVLIARAFPHRPPSVEELQKRFEMSRATAYRWRAAFVDSMGLSA